MHKIITLTTTECEQLVDITDEVRAVVRESGIRDGGGDDSGKLGRQRAAGCGCTMHRMAMVMRA